MVGCALGFLVAVFVLSYGYLWFGWLVGFVFSLIVEWIWVFVCGLVLLGIV